MAGETIEVQAEDVKAVANQIRSAANAFGSLNASKDSQSTIAGNSSASSAIDRLQTIASKMSEAGNSYASALESVATAIQNTDSKNAAAMASHD